VPGQNTKDLVGNLVIHQPADAPGVPGIDADVLLLDAGIDPLRDTAGHPVPVIITVVVPLHVTVGLLHVTDVLLSVSPLVAVRVPLLDAVPAVQSNVPVVQSNVLVVQSNVPVVQSNVPAVHPVAHLVHLCVVLGPDDRVAAQASPVDPDPSHEDATKWKT